LKRFAQELVEKAASILPNPHLLSGLPPALTYHDLAEVNILLNPEGSVTGVLDFDEAQVEAFGMCIFGIYECFIGCMENGKWVIL
jgi:Ser/Thr protein kinase RdoA (MazF antagonist)